MSLCLLVRNGAASGQRLELSQGTYSVGRGRECDLRLPDALCSRVHCHLDVEERGVSLRDNGSKHGTRVGGERISTEVKLFGGEDLELGGTRLSLVLSPTGLGAASQTASASLAREWIGESPPMRALHALIDRAAASDASVLITGETGTGKELVARAIHRSSARNARPFLAANCAAISASLIEAELFGHEAGAFTGASAQRPGLFELAHGGTLLLDELGDMPLELQPRLLRVLQEGSFRRLGGDVPVAVDVRVLASTLRPLGDPAVRVGYLRDDLFYRVSGLTIEVPPLRARGDDLRLLAQRMLQDLGVEAEPSAEAWSALLAHPWPGNVRELKNTLARASVLAGAGPLTPAHFALGEAPQPDDALTLRELEARHIRRVLERTGNNVKASAEQLGVSRSALYEKMKRHGIAR